MRPWSRIRSRWFDGLSPLAVSIGTTRAWSRIATPAKSPPRVFGRRASRSTAPPWSGGGVTSLGSASCASLRRRLESDANRFWARPSASQRRVTKADSGRAGHDNVEFRQQNLETTPSGVRTDLWATRRDSCLFNSLCCGSMVGDIMEKVWQKFRIWALPGMEL